MSVTAMRRREAVAKVLPVRRGIHGGREVDFRRREGAALVVVMVLEDSILKQRGDEVGGRPAFCRARLGELYWNFGRCSGGCR